MTVSAEDRGKIIGMLKARAKPAHIAREVGVSRSTVYRFKDESAANNGAIPQPKAKSGRNENVTLGQIRRVKRLISRHPFWSARRVRDAHPSLAGLKVGRVSKLMFKTLKLKARRAAAKPPMKERMLQDRKRSFSTTQIILLFIESLF